MTPQLPALAAPDLHREIAALVGVAGNSFSAGIAWNSAWAPKGRKGLFLGIFGAGNAGARPCRIW